VTRFAWRRTRYFSSVFAGFPTCGSPSIQPSAVSSCANLHRYCPRKWYTSIPSIPVSNTPFIQHSIQPQVYSSSSSCWSPLESSPTRRFLRPEELLRVVSWNIDFMAPGREQRGYQAMDHLRDHLGQTLPPSLYFCRKCMLSRLTESSNTRGSGTTLYYRMLRLLNVISPS
jgi:hypothetical protein